MKANAYGHGIRGVLSAYETFTDWYAVATLEEGLAIREGSEKPILLFSPIPEAQIKLAAEKSLTFTVGSMAYAQMLANQLESAGLTADCHLKIDTGLNRFGIRWRNQEKALKEIQDIHKFKSLRFSGTYTHFACGEGERPCEREFTALQFNRFAEACSAMQRAAIPVGLQHCCSTGGSLVHPEYRMDMVRLGMMPLGISYSDDNVKTNCLKPAMTWISFVAQVEEVQPGESISYGCTYRADKPMRVGIVTCGYADGYRRAYSNKTYVLAGGRKVPVVGRVAMDSLMINLTEVENPFPGMEVTLLGSNGDGEVTAMELSQYGESVSGEVTCTISDRVPRVYINQ